MDCTLHRCPRTVTNISDFKEYFFNYYSLLNAHTPKNKAKPALYLMKFADLSKEEYEQMKLKFA